jgi:hypothetical protein
MLETFQILEPFLYHPIEKIRFLAFQIVGNYIATCDDAVDYVIGHH